MTWSEYADYVQHTVANLAYGVVPEEGTGLLIVENPDGEGGGYDVYTVPTREEAVELADKINRTGKTCAEIMPPGANFEAHGTSL